MSSSYVFVHGTGVRGKRYKSTFDLLKKHLGGDLTGCYWGASQGARLGAYGVSIPHYDVTGGTEPSEEEEELALWAVLYTDPWYELRGLRDRADNWNDLPGVISPADALREQIATFEPSTELLARLANCDLREDFEEGLVALRASDEFHQAAKTAVADPLEHRQAIGRALLAYALAATEDTGATIVGKHRAALTEQITHELGGYGRGIGDWASRSVKGFAARAVTNRITRKRGAITDSSAQKGGDVLLYQARGEGIRAAINQAVADTGSDDVTLIAHSLGGIACVDMLVLDLVPQVKRLVTVGSQAPFLYEIGALVSLEFPNPLPDHFPRWLNIYDSRDLLSYVGEGLFPGRVTDVAVDNGQPFPQSHSAYWGNEDLWIAIERFVK
jgi:hypothetical protein